MSDQLQFFPDDTPTQREAIAAIERAEVETDLPAGTIITEHVLAFHYDRDDADAHLDISGIKVNEHPEHVAGIADLSARVHSPDALDAYAAALTEAADNWRRHRGETPRRQLTLVWASDIEDDAPHPDIAELCKNGWHILNGDDADGKVTYTVWKYRDEAARCA